MVHLSCYNFSFVLHSGVYRRDLTREMSILNTLSILRDKTSRSSSVKISKNYFIFPPVSTECNYSKLTNICFSSLGQFGVVILDFLT